MSIILAFILIGIGAVFLVISYFYYKSKQDYSNSSNLGTPEKKPWSHTWVYVLFEILAISLLVFVFWDKIALYFSDTPNLPDFSFDNENSFFTTWDWTTFPWVQTHLGGAGDTIIWTLVILAIWWLVSTVLELLFSKKENRKIEYGVSGWLFFILLIGTGSYVFISAITNSDKDPETKKVEKSSFVSISLVKKEPGYITPPTQMDYRDTIKLSLSSVHVDKYGGKTIWSCPEVVMPEILSEPIIFEVAGGKGTYNLEYRITNKGQQYLLNQRVSSVDIIIKRVLSDRNKNPCEFLIY